MELGLCLRKLVPASRQKPGRVGLGLDRQGSGHVGCDLLGLASGGSLVHGKGWEVQEGSASGGPSLKLVCFLFGESRARSGEAVLPLGEVGLKEGDSAWPLCPRGEA